MLYSSEMEVDMDMDMEQARQEAARLLGKHSAEARKGKTDYQELGKKGGPGRMKKLNAEGRSALGKKGAEARWAKHRAAKQQEEKSAD